MTKSTRLSLYFKCPTCHGVCTYTYDGSTATGKADYERAKRLQLRGEMHCDECKRAARGRAK